MPRRHPWLAGFLLLAAFSALADEPKPHSPDGGSNCISQSFDGVIAPALPLGWSAANGTGPSPLWTTDTTSPDTPPNDAFVPVPVPQAVSDKWLLSPPIPIMSGASQVTFRHSYSFASGDDGGVLEVSVDGGLTFYDIKDLTVGEITSGFYDTMIVAPDNPLNGRNAWSGDSGGYKTTTLDFLTFEPSMVPGNDVIFRWRMGSSSQGTGGYWRVDSITVTQPCALPAFISVDKHSSTNTPAGTALNGVFEPGEAVVVEPAYVDRGSSDVVLTGSAGLGGPLGANYMTLDSAADYGTIVPDAVSDCFSATDNCYFVFVDNPDPRPAAHWDAWLGESLSNGGYKFWTLHIGSSFADEPSSDSFYPFVENIFHNGVTGGCGNGNYCPSNGALRKQMAAFVLRAKLGKAYQPPPCVGTFTDVPCPGPFTDWIEDLYRRGVVAGCGAGPAYCPDNAVSRQQMAVFLLKTLEGSGYVPPACVGIFTDVPCSNPFAPWIEDLYNRQIAAGCGGGNYCPTSATTRAQMAVFLVKTFGLVLYGP